MLTKEKDKKYIVSRRGITGSTNLFIFDRGSQQKGQTYENGGSST